MSIESDIREFLIQTLGHAGDPADLTLDYPLIETGVVDSMGMLELILWIEQRYGIDVQDEDVLPVNFGSVGSIATYIGARLSKGAGTAGVATG